MAKQLERDIQFTVCEYLSIKYQNNPNVMFWRQNTMPVVKPDGSFRAMPKYSMTGVPDIILVKDGIFWGLEIKRPGGKQSENQMIFQHKLEKAGGKYHIITSLDDILALKL